MKPVEFEGQNVLLSPPAGSPRGTCGALPVLRLDDAGVVWISIWRPSSEDLAALNAGGHVRLAVHGASHPPVWIDAIAGVVELP